MRTSERGTSGPTAVRAARVCAVVTVAAGTVCLVGYAVGVRRMASVLPDVPAMPAITALTLILAGAGLWLVAPAPAPANPEVRRRIGHLCGAMVAVMGVVLLAEYFAGGDAVVDRLLFPDLVEAWRAVAVAGRPAPNTGLGFLVAGLTLALLDAGPRRGSRLADVFAPLGMFIAITALLSASYGLTDVSGSSGLPGMAPHTALALLVLMTGVLACRPQRGAVRVFTSPGSGGVTVRRLAPVAVGVVLVVGVLLGAADRAQMTVDGLSVTLAMASITLLGFLAFLYIGTVLDRAGGEHQRLAGALRDNHNFNETVLNSLIEGVAALDPDCVLVQVTPRWCEITGYRPEEVLGLRPPFPWWPPELVETRLAALADLLRSTGPAEFDTQLIRSDGARIDVLATTSPILDADGRLQTLVTTVRDLSERRRADQERRRLAEQLDHLFAMSDDLMCIAGTDGYLKRLNPAWERTLGHPVEELLARPYIEFVHPDDLPSTQAIAAGMAQRRLTSVVSQARLRCRDGTYRWINWNATVALSEGLIYGIGRDVTEQQQSHEAGALLAAIVDSTNEAIIGKTLDGTITSWNNAAERIYGYRADEVLGRSLRTLFPPDRRDEFENNLAHIGRGEPVADHHSVRVRKDGTLVHIGLSVSPIRNTEGQVVGGASIVRDITDRQRAAEQFQRLVLKAPVAMVLVSADGTVQLVNEHTERLFGYTAAELVGKHIEHLVPHQLRELHAGHRQQYLVAPVIRSMGAGQDLYGQRKDGTQFPVEIGLAPLDMDDGQLVAAVIHDITDRKQIQHTLATARDEALAAAQLRSQFVAMVSHEIRTPMNGVIGLTNLLLGSDLDPTQQRYADAIRVSAQALLTIINDILDFSKIEAGKVTLVQADFDLGALVEDVVNVAAEASRDKGLEIIGCYPADAPVTVRGDEGRLRQVLLNLIGNAVKFTEHGEVILRVDVAGDASPDNRLFTFSVSDTGIGIAPVDLGRLFEAFTQADSTTSRRFGGTGLGLTISQQLVELMGGRLEVDSQPDQGSRFFFTIPIAIQADPPARPARIRDRLLGCRILIVDDNMTSRDLLAEHARSWGMTAVTATDAQAALAALADAVVHGGAYDVAVIDQRMPGTDGLHLAGRILDDPAIPPPHIVVLSSGAHQQDPIPAALTGIRMLPKPVGPSALYNCLVQLRDPDAIEAAREFRRSTAAEARPNHGLVLLAEDNDINQMVALETLAMLGYEADLACNGAEAVQLAATKAYKAILMDCQMPKMDGFEATRELRRREQPGQRVPIIALTAGALTEDRQRCLDAGMDDYVAKPIDPDDLRTALERVSV
jgi:PAS domain S-box-containing protein